MKEREALKLALDALKIEQAALAYEHGKVEHIENAITAAEEALAQPEQEPVAWTPKIERHYKDGVLIEQTIQYNPQGEKLPYPQRTWVGLTDEEIYNLKGFYDYMTKEEFFEAIRGVEAKLKEKNT